MKIANIHLDTVDSTNTYAKEQCQTFDPEALTCIIAEEQTAGRGRFGKGWLSPRGKNLYVTFCFHLPSRALHLNSAGLVLAYSLCSLLLDDGLFPKIKWPNDLQLKGKKVAGILSEASSCNDFVVLFIGIGINVNMESSLLAQIDQPATSLKVETGREWDRKELLEKLQNRFLLHLAQFKKEGFAPFHNPCENLLAYKGQKICCLDGKRRQEGICHSLTQEGQLNLYLPDQQMYTCIAGEIFEVDT